VAVLVAVPALAVVREFVAWRAGVTVVLVAMALARTRILAASAGRRLLVRAGHREHDKRRVTAAHTGGTMLWAPFTLTVLPAAPDVGLIDRLAPPTLPLTPNTALSAK
jgi:hypothetical protein